MLAGLGYIDCKMMVLGTKLFIAKNKVRSEMSYATHVAAVKTDKVTTGVKNGVTKVKKNVDEKIKNIKKDKAEASVDKKKEVKNTEETVVNAEATTTVEETSAPVKENVVDVNFAEVKKEEEVKEGPDFSLLQGVTYDPDPSVSNFVPVEDVKVPEADATLVYTTVDNDGETVVITGTPDDMLTVSEDARPATEADIVIAISNIKDKQNIKSAKAKKK